MDLLLSTYIIVGCERGHYYDLETGDCKACPKGSYQDVPHSQNCRACPSGYSTRSTGTVDIDMCIGMNSPLALNKPTNKEADDIKMNVWSCYY